ncbi:MAG: decaprenyl-phosphate phosphoribosyltransferase [Acidimicrobiales bacterium]
MTNGVAIEARPGGRSAPAVIRALRPKQWAKNVLVYAAPGSAGLLTQARPLLLTTIAAGLFCAAASATDLINDARDVEADRRHPTKRFRPIAAGELSVGFAYLLAGVLGLGAVVGGWLIDGQLALVLAAYMALTVSYSIWLKHVPVIDIMTVAAGFMLRTLAGAAAVGVVISNWFFVVTMFGSLLMVAGKRESELADAGADGATRPVMRAYTDAYLRQIRGVATSGAALAYSLWAFERADVTAVAGHGQPLPFYQVSILPFLTGCLYYSLLIEHGRGEAPESLVLGDRLLQIIGVSWLALFLSGLWTTA